MGRKRYLRVLVCLTLALALLLGTTVSAQAAERTVTILKLKNVY